MRYSAVVTTRLFSTFLAISSAGLASDQAFEITGIPAGWEQALPVANALVLDNPQKTSIRAFPSAPVFPFPANIGETSGNRNPLENPVSEYLMKYAQSPAIELEIQWTNGDRSPELFIRSVDFAKNLTSSTHRIGTTTYIRTTVYSDRDKAFLIHFRADQPGALNLSARITTLGRATIQNRRQILWQSPDSETKARVWVIPFESEVSHTGDAISIPGEGEALLILNTDGSDTLKSLGDRYDPGRQPPNPSLVWHGIVDDQPES